MSIARGDVVGASHGLIGAGDRRTVHSRSLPTASRVVVSERRRTVRGHHLGVGPQRGRCARRAATTVDGHHAHPLRRAAGRLDEDLEPDHWRRRRRRIATWRSPAAADLVIRLRITGIESAGSTQVAVSSPATKSTLYYQHRSSDLFWSPTRPSNRVRHGARILSTSRSSERLRASESTLGLRIFT